MFTPKGYPCTDTPDSNTVQRKRKATDIPKSRTSPVIETKAKRATIAREVTEASEAITASDNERNEPYPKKQARETTTTTEGLTTASAATSATEVTRVRELTEASEATIACDNEQDQPRPTKRRAREATTTEELTIPSAATTATEVTRVRELTEASEAATASDIEQDQPPPRKRVRKAPESEAAQKRRKVSGEKQLKADRNSRAISIGIDIGTAYSGDCWS
jgi:hypothetical protein